MSSKHSDHYGSSKNFKVEPTSFSDHSSRRKRRSRPPDERVIPRKRRDYGSKKSLDYKEATFHHKQLYSCDYKEVPRKRRGSSRSLNHKDSIFHHKRSHSLSDYKESAKLRGDNYGRRCFSDKRTFDIMEIPYNVVPFVIGVYGHRIKDIQAESGCQIKVHDDITSNGTLICNFYGKISDIETARKMINDIIKLYPTSDTSATDETDKKEVSFWKVIKIPRNKCGFIVGQNGETLKNLQLKHSVEMKIIAQNVSHGKKLLHITGPPSNVNEAYEEVEGIINDISSTTLVVPRAAVGPIMGKCGQNLMWFSSKSGCKINLEPLESPNATEQSAILHGTVQQIAHAIHMISKLLRFCSKNVEKHSGYYHINFEELENIVG